MGLNKIKKRRQNKKLPKVSIVETILMYDVGFMRDGQYCPNQLNFSSFFIPSTKSLTLKNATNSKDTTSV